LCIVLSSGLYGLPASSGCRGPRRRGWCPDVLEAG